MVVYGFSLKVLIDNRDVIIESLVSHDLASVEIVPGWAFPAMVGAPRCSENTSGLRFLHGG